MKRRVATGQAGTGATPSSKRRKVTFRLSDADARTREEEDSQGAGDDDQGDDDGDESEESAALRRFWSEKERFKTLVKKKRLSEARRDMAEAAGEDITTSDVEYEVDGMIRERQTSDNYPIHLHLRIYMNKSLTLRKALPDTTRREFDIADVEEAIQHEIIAQVHDEPYEVQKRTAFVRVASGRGGTKYHDLDDFGIAEAERVHGLVDNHHAAFPSSTIQLTFETKLQCEAALQSKKRATSSSTKPTEKAGEDSSPATTPTQKLKDRSGKLMAQHQLRMENLGRSGDFQTQIMHRWRCADETCSNKGNVCCVSSLFSNRRVCLVSPTCFFVEDRLI